MKTRPRRTATCGSEQGQLGLAGGRYPDLPAQAYTAEKKYHSKLTFDVLMLLPSKSTDSNLLLEAERFYPVSFLRFSQHFAPTAKSKRSLPPPLRDTLRERELAGAGGIGQPTVASYTPPPGKALPVRERFRYSTPAPSAVASQPLLGSLPAIVSRQACPGPGSPRKRSSILNFRG